MSGTGDKGTAVNAVLILKKLFIKKYFCVQVGPQPEGATEQN